MATKNPKKADAAEGMAILNAPKGAKSCSWNGQEFEVEDGLVVVPNEAVLDLIPHGYTTGEPQ